MSQTFYMTVGVQYGTGRNKEPHPNGLDGDGWVEIEADSYEQARHEAFQQYGVRWAFLYDASEFHKDSYPLGCLRRLVAPPYNPQPEEPR